MCTMLRAIRSGIKDAKTQITAWRQFCVDARYCDCLDVVIR